MKTVIELKKRKTIWHYTIKNTLGGSFGSTGEGGQSKKSLIAQITRRMDPGTFEVKTLN